MSKVKYPAVLFLLVVIFSFALPLFFYKNLPVTVASHFNVVNKADSWMSRESFLIVQVIITAALSIMFLTTAFLIRKLPKSMINLPNKDYWLADERKDETYSIILRFMYWFGSLTLMFVNAVLLEVYNANIAGKSKINPLIWIYLVVYLIATIFLLIKMVTYFMKPEKS